MLFTSYGFLLFIACLLGLCIICPGKHRWKLLLAASFLFYAMSGLFYLIYITITIISAYSATAFISRQNIKQEDYFTKNAETISPADKKSYKSKTAAKNKTILVLCLLLNLGILGTLKYADFAILNINVFMEMFGGEDIAFFRFALPLGISFYTFQTMGYVVDVYRGAVSAEKNPFRLALFTSFFPHLVQGPISRFGDISESLFSMHRLSAKELSYGLQRAVLGFFKKLVIADRLIIAINIISSNPDDYHGIFVVYAALLFAIALYADFTGGIDITIGIAEALGVKLKENFNRPFYATSIADFWRRWHITMGTWFRDYMYYPLLTCKPMTKLSKLTRKIFGTGFGKRLPIYITTITVWLTIGLWHGATWNFVLWGLFNGFIIMISQELTPLYEKFHERFKIGQTSIYYAWQILRTFCLLSLIRILYIYRDVGTYFRAIGTLFTDIQLRRLLSGDLLQLGLSIYDYIVTFSAVLLLIFIGQISKETDIRDTLQNRPRLVRYMIILIMVFSTIIFGIYGTGYNAAQFIYNQF